MRLFFSSILLVSLWGCTRETSSLPSSMDSLRVRSDSALCLLEESMSAPAESSPLDTIVKLVPYKEERVVARVKQRVDTVWVRDTVYIVK
jgi:hypothetical protein